MGVAAGGRAFQLDREGPRIQRHRPRLVPPHGADIDDAHAHVPLRRAQPAGPGFVRGPPGRRATACGARARAGDNPRRRRRTISDLVLADTPV